MDREVVGWVVLLLARFWVFEGLNLLPLLPRHGGGCAHGHASWRGIVFSDGRRW